MKRFNFKSEIQYNKLYVKNKGIVLAQININGSKNYKILELKYILLRYNIDIVCIQEFKYDMLNIDGYK